MDLHKFLAACSSLPGRSGPPDKYQSKVISHGAGPLWVVAGPGSGKTDSMALRCLKLMVVDDIPPRSIVVTTFTEKAARNLEDRIALYMQSFASKFPEVAGIDYSRLRIGTLHSICNDVMQEFRFVGYQNFRLLTDMEQRLFVMEHSSLAGMQPPPTHDAVWQSLHYLATGYDPVGGGQWRPGSGRAPNRWVRARAAQTLFNRIVEDSIDVQKMRAAGGHWSTVADAYDEYCQKLFGYHRCDFAHLQTKFLEFLESHQSGLFLVGDGSDQFPGVKHVLVDEYQDTNPIQERIYLKLAQSPPHNLCVVGDDDQALYRFRGGTVECMVNFAAALHRSGFKVGTIPPNPLPVNYRSHDAIVKFCDSYIGSFAVMSTAGARAPGKQPLQSGAGIGGTHPAVSILARSTAQDVADAFSDLVVDLLAQGTISSPGRCALLMRSTRNSVRNAQPFMEALTARSIPYYNPRSRALLDEPSVQLALGAFLEIVDPGRQAQNAVHGAGIHALANSWRAAYQQSAQTFPALANYVSKSATTIGMIGPASAVGANIAEVFYHILSYDPFPNWIEDATQTKLIGVITQVFEAFSNVPTPSRPNSTLGDLYTSSIAGAGISFNWRKSFYYSLLGVLAGDGLNEPEDPEENIPVDRVPILTVHQAKGLEFPFVFVYGLSPSSSYLQPGSSTLLEADLAPYRGIPPTGSQLASVTDKTLQDTVRFYYVAYSRAQYALVLLATRDDVRRQGMGFGEGGTTWLSGKAQPI